MSQEWYLAYSPSLNETAGEAYIRPRERAVDLIPVFPVGRLLFKQAEIPPSEFLFWASWSWDVVLGLPVPDSGPVAAGSINVSLENRSWINWWRPNIRARTHVRPDNPEDMEATNG